MPRPNISSSTVASFLLRALHTPSRPLARTKPSQFTCAFAARTDRIRNFSSTPIWQSFKLIQFATKSEIRIGGHKILDWDRFELPKLSESTHKITVRGWPAEPELEGSDKEVKRVTAQVSLEDAYNNGIKPGWFLVPNEPVPKKVGQDYAELSKPNNLSFYSGYTLVQTRGNVQIAKKTVRSSSKAVKLTAALKELNFEITAPTSFYRLVMEKAHAFLKAGHPVEFNVRAKQRTDKSSPEMLPLILNHFPHLRPDFILASMPEGCSFNVDPFRSGNHIKFGIQMYSRQSLLQGRPGGLTKALLTRKKQVADAIEAGQASQLPKKLREQLIKKGYNQYSLDTSVPKHLAKPSRQSVLEPRWGAESLVPSPAMRQAKRAHKRLTRKEREKQKRMDEAYAELVAGGMDPREAAKRFEQQDVHIHKEIQKVKKNVYERAVAAGTNPREAAEKAKYAGKMERKKRSRATQHDNQRGAWRLLERESGSSSARIDEFERDAQASFLQDTKEQQPTRNPTSEPDVGKPVWRRVF